MDESSDINVDGPVVPNTLNNDTTTAKKDVSGADSIFTIQRKTVNRQKVYYTMCIYAAFTSMGGILGQIGPSLLDIQSITGVGLEKGSWMVTSVYIGYTVGTLLNGILFHRSNIAAMFAIGLLLLCSGFVSIPFCSIYSVTVTIFSGIGLFEGLLDTAGNAEIVRVWKEKSRNSLMLLHFSFYFGGVISPLYTAPFLMITNVSIHNKSTIQSDVNGTLTHDAYGSRNTSVLTSYNISVFANDVLQSKKSLFFVPFAITSTATAIVSVIFFVQILCMDDLYAVTQTGHTDTRKKNGEDIPKFLKVTGIASLCGIMTVSNAIANAFASYLSTFCVGSLKWTKVNGSIVTSLFYIFTVIGNLVGIAFSKCLTNTVYAGISCFLMMTSFIVLVISVKTDFSVGVWAGSAILGYGKSTILPVVMSWVNEKFTTFTGKLSSLFFLGGMVGCILNTLFVAFLMENYSGIWFCYLFLIESLILIILYLIAAQITRCIQRKHPLTITNVLLVNRNNIA